RCKVLWMREQHRPGISDPVMEADAAFRRLGLKIRSDIIDLQRHVLTLSWLVSCRRVETRRAGCSYLRTASYSSSTESVLVREVRNTYLCGSAKAEDHTTMTTRSQFCPVTKAAEVFADRWTPIIIRELCFGTRSFGELLEAAPPISRTMLP